MRSNRFAAAADGGSDKPQLAAIVDATNRPPHVAVEICVDSVDGALIAEQAGADRIELCAGLVEGGTTPSIGTVRSVLATLHRVGVQVLIRPRRGDFLYTARELAVMLADIEAIHALPSMPGVTVGFVTGALTADGDVDIPTMRQFVGACEGAPVTFHRAFDFARDPLRALEDLVDLGVRWILTSGGRPRAIDGAERIRQLVRSAHGRITVLAGGGVRPDHVDDLVAQTGVTEVHLRATTSTPSTMHYWPADLAISAASLPGDISQIITSAETIREVLRALGG